MKENLCDVEEKKELYRRRDRKKEKERNVGRIQSRDREMGYKTHTKKNYDGREDELFGGETEGRKRG